MKKRLFVAIQLPERLRDVFAEYQAQYSAPGLRWVSAENLHITVLFIGYADEEVLTKIEEKISNVCSKTQPFSLAFEQICFGPPSRPPRMIWAVFSGGAEYKNLSDVMYHALREFGFPDTRNKESIVHITLARFRDPSVAKAVQLPQPEVKEGVFEVLSCDLMESKLARSGAQYSVVKNFSLGQ